MEKILNLINTRISAAASTGNTTEEIFMKTIKNEKKNYQVEFYLTQDTTYTSNKESASEEEEYKEFKVGKLKAYSYKDYSSYEEVILLENISENEDRYVSIEISQISPSDDESGKFFKENKELKSILDSKSNNF